MKLSKKNSKVDQNHLKFKNLFDHLKSIRITKEKNYYNNLTESEKKDFSHWAILNGLSMDESFIETAAFLWRDGIYDKVPSKLFYRLLIELVPKANKELVWVKKNKKYKTELASYVSRWYSVSIKESFDYLNTFSKTNEGINELLYILKGFGLSDLDVEKLFE